MKTKTWYRVLFAGLLLLLGGFLYGFAGHQKEHGSIHITGMIFLAALLPWELLFLGKSKNRHKK